MSKAKKAVIIILSILAALIIGFMIWGALWIYNIPLDNYTNRTHGMLVDGQDMDSMQEDGYTIDTPWFEDNGNFNAQHMEEEWHIYNALNDPSQCYAMDVVTTFQNWADLNYTVTHDEENETLTVAFTGLGYPDGGKGEPLCLDRIFVFDVSGVQQRKTPILIKDEPADPDAVYEVYLKIMRGEYSFDVEIGKIIDMATGEPIDPNRHR